MQFYEALCSMIAVPIFAAVSGFSVGCILYEIKQHKF